MGVNGFNQAQYNQLVLDVRSGVPPPNPSLIVTLPLPQIIQSRKRKTAISGSGTDSDETGLVEVLQSPQEYNRKALNSAIG